MTPEELRALPITVDLATAAKALGIGRDLATRLARAHVEGTGKFPCKVMRLGFKYRVVTQGPDGLLAVCGVGAAPTPAGPPAVYPPA